MTSNRSRSAIRALTTILALAASAALLAATAAVATAATPLRGTLLIAPGKEVAAKKGKGGKTIAAHYVGSYFRMMLPGSTEKYFDNVNSKAKNKSYTLFVPGTEGGLKLGAFQEPPTPPFATDGFSLADEIVQPLPFAGINFSITTAPTDAQSGLPDVAPSLNVTGDKLTGNFSAWTAGWNSIYFNQGAPKPGSDQYPGLTLPVNGTYDTKTRAYQVIWRSLIVGGPFNGFTGYWHLEGKLKPS